MSLKVQDLQRFVDRLREPLGAVGVSDSALKELARVATCLEPFREVTLSAFADFLVNAQVAVQTGQWPAPGKKAAAPRVPKPPKAPKPPKVPKPTVHDAAQRIMELYERAAADPTLEFAAIDAFVETLAPMKNSDLADLAKQVDVTVTSKATKDEILREMKESIKRRKARPARTSYGSEMSYREP